MTKWASVLIGEPDAEAGAALARALEPHGFHAAAESEADAVLSRAVEERPDVVLLGAFAAPTPALDLARALKAGRRTSGLPVMLAGGADPEACRRALAIGIDDILPANAEVADIAGRLPRLARSAVMQAELQLRLTTAGEFGVHVDPDSFARRDGTAAGLFAVSDDADALAAMQENLTTAGFHVTPERAPERAAIRLESEPADAAVIRPRDGDAEGAAELCRRIRANHRLYTLPVLVAAPRLSAEDRAALYEAGAGIVLESPLDADDEMPGLYLRMMMARHRLRAWLRDPLAATRTPATVDPEVPCVYGPAFLDTHLARHVRRATARAGVLSVGIVDVRPGVADAAAEHGAEAANALWPQIADWIVGMTRIEDTVARRADGTFAVILPDTPTAVAQRVLDRISGIIEQSEFHLTEEVMAPVHVWPRTAVAGRAPGDDAAALLARADAPPA